VRFDLHDLYKANPRVFIAVAVVLAAGFALLIVEAAGGSGHGSGGSRSAQAPTSSTLTATTPGAPTSTSASGVTTPDLSYHPAYASNVPSSAIDESVASEMGASGSAAAELEAVTLEQPAWTPDYPQVSPADTRDEAAYAIAFLQELLDRNYRVQSRDDLGRWIAAESSGEMLPGVPAKAGDHALYAELMDPKAVGAPFTVVPSAAEWASLRRSGATQHVYDLIADPDPLWAEFQSKGFTSTDPLMDVEDVTGVIKTTEAGRTTTNHLSTQVLLGSALHHPGYGSWGLGQWQVS
jgi:hypothetical protein